MAQSLLQKKTIASDSALTRGQREEGVRDEPCRKKFCRRECECPHGGDPLVSAVLACAGRANRVHALALGRRASSASRLRSYCTAECAGTPVAREAADRA